MYVCLSVHIDWKGESVCLWRHTLQQAKRWWPNMLSLWLEATLPGQIINLSLLFSFSPFSLSPCILHYKQETLYFII